jgi:3-phosphoglycerate kinase
MKTLKDIENLKGVTVLVRADFNVPIKNAVVVEDFRIRAALPTIEFLRKGGAKIVLMSHLESIDGGKGTLLPVADRLKKLDIPVTFVENIRNARAAIETLNEGECILLENLRTFEGEKTNDKKFAQELASLADIYINEAFSASHREHASIVGVPQYIPGYAGLQLEREITNLSKAFQAPHPFLFALGGAKFETKLPLIQKFLDSADTLFVAGALANDIFKAKGYEIGESLVSKGDIDLSPYTNNPKVILPIDVTVAPREIKNIGTLTPTDKIMDAGPQTIEMLRHKISEAKFILWNGPLGLYEDGYQGPTLELAKMIGEATSRGAETIVGGGDTLAAIATLRIEDKFTFISTGGGAMLDFLALGTLPAIEALEKSHN